MNRAFVRFFGTRNVRAGVVFMLTISFLVLGCIVAATTDRALEFWKTVVFPVYMLGMGILMGSRS